MKEYIAPQAKVVSFDNDYVATAPDDNGKPDRSNNNNYYDIGCGSGSNWDGKSCNQGGGGGWG